METTRQAVACRWCGTQGTDVCPACQAAETIAIRYLENIGRLSQANLELAMSRYLASRPQDADRPTPPEPKPFDKCPYCNTEPVYKPAWACWQCGYAVRVK